MDSAAVLRQKSVQSGRTDWSNQPVFPSGVGRQSHLAARQNAEFDKWLKSSAFQADEQGFESPTLYQWLLECGGRMKSCQDLGRGSNPLRVAMFPVKQGFAAFNHYNPDGMA